MDWQQLRSLCFYVAGAEVKSTDQIPDGMMTMKYIYGSWLPKSGQKLRDAPDLEIYDQLFKPDSEESELDIYIPVY